MTQKLVWNKKENMGSFGLRFATLKIRAGKVAPEIFRNFINNK